MVRDVRRWYVMFETLIDLERPMYARGLSLQGMIDTLSAHMMHTSDPLHGAMTSMEPYKKSIAQLQFYPLTRATESIGSEKQTVKYVGS